MRKSKIYITGDCHRKFDKIFDFCKNNKTTTNDIMIIAGDAGINYYIDSSDKKVKKKLSTLPITLLVLHGNHEERAWNCEGYIHDNYQIGSNFIIGWAEKEYPNLLFLDNYATPYINGNRYLFLGGAYSVDKGYRLAMGYQWFKSEQMTDEEMELNLKRLQKDRHAFNYSVGRPEEHQFKYVVSHTSPLKYEPTEVFLPFIDQSTVDKRTEEFLNKVEEIIDYESWICAHFHTEKEIDRIRFIYNDIIKLE